MFGGANTSWVPAGSSTMKSNTSGPTSAPLGMNGILRLITPITMMCPSGWVLARSIRSSITSGLEESESRIESPLPSQATACASTLMPLSSMSRATWV